MSEVDTSANAATGASWIATALGGAAGGYLAKEAYDKLGQIGACGYEEFAGERWFSRYTLRYA
jgi:hypothetical protein